jgi:hypothetical protein
MRWSGWDARNRHLFFLDNYFTRLIYFAIGSRHTPLMSADAGNFGSHGIDCFRARVRMPGVVISNRSPLHTWSFLAPPSPQLLNVPAMNTSPGILLEQLISKTMRTLSSTLFILNF